MTPTGTVRTVLAAVAGGLLLGLVLQGCVVAGGGYNGDNEGYLSGYYEPYGYLYGASDWGPTYRFGPPHRGALRGSGGGGRFRAAPAGRAVPSLPGRGRGGGPGSGPGGGRRQH